MRLIDADALKEKLDELERYIDCDENLTTWIQSDEVYKAVDNAQTVELNESVIQKVLNPRCMTVITNEYLIELQNKRPQGEWKIGGRTTHYHYCSICGKDGDLQDNFCRNCGARMKGGTE